MKLPATGLMGRGMETILSRWFLVIIVATVIRTGNCQGESTDVYVTEQQDKVLECRFDPRFTGRNPVYYWSRANKKGQDNVAIGDQSLDNHYSVELNKIDGKYKLYITNTSYVNDNGKFQCKVKESGTGKDLHVQIFKLVVLIVPGSPQIASTSAVATEGKPFQLTCSSTGGSPDPEINWYRDGENSPLEGSYEAGGNNDIPTVNVLTLNPQKEDDGVRYICKINNVALEQKQRPPLEASFEMQVNYIPRVSIQPRNPLRVERGTLTSASCRVDSKPEPISIKWTHNGRIVSNGANLSIKLSSIEDAGSYVCSADNGLGLTGQAELDVDMLYGPTIEMESKREAKENEDVVVHCNVRSNPPGEIIWFREGDPTFTVKGAVLRLEKISAKSMGRYTCEATNELYPSLGPSPIRKAANATVAIWIKHKPGNTVIYPEKTIAVEGKFFSLMCVANPPGWPEPTYKWWKDSPTNHLRSGMNYTISQVRMSHEGTYYCQASNDLGEGNVASAELKVHEPPHLLTPLQAEIIKKVSDSGMYLSCEARAKPRPSVRWLKNGQFIDSSSSVDITSKESVEDNGASVVKTTLKFFGPDRPNNNMLTVDDGAVYVCEFNNDVGKPARSNTTLKIEHGPILGRTERKVAFDMLSTAFLECRMQAFPAPTFEWSFQNTIVTSGSQRYQINQTDLGNDIYLSTLSINHVRETDYGEYTCSASNKIDTAKTHIRLVPRGAPETPYDVKIVNVTHDSIVLHWINGFNGGYPDTKYVVTYSSGDGFEYDKTCSQADCFIGDLNEMTEYYFQVQAQNEKGTSDTSNRVAVQTKIDANSIPYPSSVYFNRDTSDLIFTIPKTRFAVVGKIELATENNDSEYVKDVPIPNSEVRLNIKYVVHENHKIYVSLCLKNDSNVCGQPKQANYEIPPSVLQASDSLSTQNVITIAVSSVVGIILLIGIAIVCCCCCCRRNPKEKNIKKDYEMEAPNARPKAITGPYYPEGIVNKGIDNSVDNDDTTKTPQYGTHIPIGNNQSGMDRPLPPHHMSNGNLPPGYSYLDREFNNSNGGSVNSQDSLWLKSNGGEGNNDRGYSYDPSLNNAYLYPDDYHHMHEDMMNQRNREHIYNSDPYAPINKPKKRNDHLDVYHDVSDMPDPYMEEEEKVPHNSISFDESLESGYSTPNSRSRRVIREIIV